MRTPDYFGRLLVRQMRNGTTWVSQCIFGFSSTLGITVQVPVGFATDYASIPRALWSFLPPTGTYAAAAVIHDWLYWTQTTTREEADQVFREAMLVSCVGAAKRATIYQLPLPMGLCQAMQTNISETRFAPPNENGRAID